MILSYAVYAICILLILWGIKFAGFENKFNDDFLDKSSTKAICGFFALTIIFHHISQREAFQDITRELYFFNQIGYLFVLLFFFSSGYGLTVSADSNPNYLDNFKRRVLTVFVPYFVTNVIFTAYNAIGGIEPLKAILGVLGLIGINPNGWYPVVLLIFYGVFYFSRKHIKKSGLRLVLYFLTTILLIVVFCVNGHFAWWSDTPGWWFNYSEVSKAAWWRQNQILLFSGEWWVNSCIGFFVGALFGTYKDKIVNWFKKGYWIKLIVLIVLFVASYRFFNEYVIVHYGYWTEYGYRDPRILDKLITSFGQLAVSLTFILALVVLMMKVRTENPVTRFLGTITYETYLIGNLVIVGFEFLINKNNHPYANPSHSNLAIYAVAVVIVTIVLGFALNKLDGFLVKKLTSKKK